MKKYENFDNIPKKSITTFRGLENEESFYVEHAVEITPIRITRIGITNPDSNYYIERQSAPVFILEYVVRGVGYLEINGEKHKLGAGDAYIIHPGDSCKYYADKNDPYKKYWINFSCLHFFNDLLKSYGINDRVVRGVDLSKSFEELFKLENFSVSNDDLYIPASKIIFNMLMDIALHKHNNSKRRDFDLAATVKGILNRSANKTISLTDIANSLYRTKNDIIRQFKKRYGVTPYTFLIDLRIRLAKNLLENTDKTLAEIASYLCFSSEYHLSNTFKKKVGVSPKEYRKAQSNI